MPYRSFKYDLDLGALGVREVEVEYEPGDKPELVGVWNYSMKRGHAVDMMNELTDKASDVIHIAILKHQAEYNAEKQEYDNEQDR